MNILLGLALISFVIYCYFGVDKSAIENTVLGIIIPAYIGLSGCIIILVECRLEIVCRNMKFLYNYIGRGIFNFYVGVMPLALIPEYPITDSAKLFKILTIVLASLTCLVGLLYILAKILCCAKEA